VKVLFFIAVAVPALAQLQISVLTPEGPQPVGVNFTLPAAAAGDSVEVRLRALNLSASQLPLQTLTVSGAAFSLAAPLQPVTLAPGAAHEFAVRFSPQAPGSYSALLTVNSSTAFLRANAEWAPALAVLIDGKPVLIPAGGYAADAFAGVETVLSVAVWNNRTVPLTVSQISAAHPSVRLRNLPTLPLTLEPDQHAAFQLAAIPEREGPFTAQLNAGLATRTITLNVTRPKLPLPRLAAAAVLANAAQTPIRVAFDEPAPADGAGKLRVSLQGAFPDPAIQFSNGSSEVNFQVAKGSLEATFEGRPSVTLQTGTTAGTLIVEASTESGSTRQSWLLQSSPIVIDSSRAIRSPQSIEITLSGYDNTRTAGSLNFRFFDRAGAPRRLHHCHAAIRIRLLFPVFGSRRRLPAPRRLPPHRRCHNGGVGTGRNRQLHRPHRTAPSGLPIIPCSRSRSPSPARTRAAAPASRPI
jgi:hypothetical protein